MHSLCYCSSVSNDTYGPMPAAPWNRWKSKFWHGKRATFSLSMLVALKCFSVWRTFDRALMSMEGENGFCDTKQTKKCDKIAWQKIGEPKLIFLSRFLWSLVRSDKILSRRNTPVALVNNTRRQYFLQSKQSAKFCSVIWEGNTELLFKSKTSRGQNSALQNRFGFDHISILLFT